MRGSYFCTIAEVAFHDDTLRVKEVHSSIAWPLVCSEGWSILHWGPQTGFSPLCVYMCVQNYVRRRRRERGKGGEYHHNMYPLTYLPSLFDHY